jgi:FOG: TPR repeat, SEL1 subfamily
MKGEKMKIRSIISLVLVLVMLFSLGMSAFADDELSNEELYDKAAKLYYIDNNHDDIYELVKDAESTGYAPLIRLLYICYGNGYGVEKDNDEAFRLKNLAGDKGDILSQYSVAVSYEQGNGTEADPEKAQVMYADLFDQIKDEYENGTDQYTKYEFARLLAQYYYYGDGGIERDMNKAIEYYEEALELGSSIVATYLSTIYLNGEGVEKDYKKALNYALKAAEDGDGKGMVIAGNIYLNGFGVDVDYTKALEYFQAAADVDEPLGYNYLGDLYFNGYGVEQDYAKAVEYYEKAVEMDCAQACLNLGRMYYEGLGVQKDLAKTKVILEKGAALGNQDCITNLNNLF